MDDVGFIDICRQTIADGRRILRFHAYDNVALNTHRHRLQTNYDGLERRADTYDEAYELLRSMEELVEGITAALATNHSNEEDRTIIRPAQLTVSRQSIELLLKERITVAEVAKRLVVSRKTIYEKVDEYNLQHLVRAFHV